MYMMVKRVSFQLATDRPGRQQYPGVMFRHVSCPLTLYSILFFVFGTWGGLISTMKTTKNIQRPPHPLLHPFFKGNLNHSTFALNNFGKFWVDFLIDFLWKNRYIPRAILASYDSADVDAVGEACHFSAMGLTWENCWAKKIPSRERN